MEPTPAKNRLAKLIWTRGDLKRRY